jgi:hypothetical protein
MNVPDYHSLGGAKTRDLRDQGESGQNVHKIAVFARKK